MLCRIRPLAAGGRVKAKPVPFMHGRTGGTRQVFENVKLCNVLALSNTAHARQEVSPTADASLPRSRKLLILMTSRCRAQQTQKQSDGWTGNTGEAPPELCYVRQEAAKNRRFNVNPPAPAKTNIALS
jgi:hypothetical protein